MKNELCVALLGYGVVGSGTAEVLIKNKNLIEQRTGKNVKLKYIFVRPNKELPSSLGAIATSNFDKIILDDDVKIVIECLGGLDAAYHFTREALISGKHVVTSNKELVAAKGTELLKLAMDKKVRYLFDASVLGAVPAVRNLRQTLVANDIKKISGIVNGTTNFILTRMRETGNTYEEELLKAQQLGYAEKNAEADVAGLDAARKLCILSSIAYGMEIKEDMIYTEGIKNITKEDMIAARKYGCKIKLVATTTKISSSCISAIVAPRFVSKSELLANVEDVYNIVTVDCDMASNISFIGKGAGKLTTASAVVADVLNVLTLDPIDLPLEWTKNDAMQVEDFEDMKSSYFIRFKDESGDFSINKKYMVKYVANLFGVKESDCHDNLQTCDFENLDSFAVCEKDSMRMKIYAVKTAEMTRREINRAIEKLHSENKDVIILNNIRYYK